MIKRILPLLLTAALMAVSSPRLSASAAPAVADVIVYGATPGGFCAAIAAAREGASVILLEPTDHVGGVNTGGLSFSDSNQTVRSTLKGLFEEWHLRVEKDYLDRGIPLPYRVDVKDHAQWTYEPSVAARVTHRMLEEAKVRVLVKTELQSVAKDGPRIKEITTSGGIFRARTFIDATYEGDLMAAAGVGWTIGREGRKEHGESLAGRQYPKPRIPISGLDEKGRPLPLITTTDAGPEENGDRRVMVYSFRLCLTGDEANRVPFPAPASYDPARFEVVRRYFLAVKTAPLPWDLYPLPNGKFDANNGIGKQFSMGLVGGGNEWCEVDAAGRARIWEAHKQYTLEMYHFLTTDPAVPPALRQQLARLGLCKDEFTRYGHWSPQLYVREGRRMKGMHVLTQDDIMTRPEKEDPVVVSSFPIDSHDVQRAAFPDGGVINEGTIFPVRMAGRRHGYPYHVPYRSLLPRPEECDNLLVPVALSCTHVALSSIRVEPTWMALGQSAGIAAALAAKTGSTVQQVPYPALKARLLAQGQVLDLPVLPPAPPPPPTGPVSLDPAKLPGIVLDDTQAELAGSWNRSSNFKPHVGIGYLHDNRRGDGQSKATFRTTVPVTGRYLLRLAYSPHESRARKMPLVVETGGKRTKIEFDETLPLEAGDAFRTASTLDLVEKEEITITLSNEGTEGFVILDALQLVRAE